MGGSQSSNIESSRVEHLREDYDGGDFMDYKLTNNYTAITRASWDFGLALGGEVGFDYKNGSRTNADFAVERIESWANANGTASYVTGETLQSESTDGSGLTTRVVTEQYTGMGDDTVYVRLNETNPWSAGDALQNPDNADVPLNEKLDNYKKRKLAIERLRGLLKDETDPDKIAALQNLIAKEENALNDLSADLLASGVTQQQLDDLQKEAANEAAKNPIDLEDFDGGDSVAGAYLYGMFFDGNYLHYLTNPSEMDDGLQNIFYGSLGVGAVAGTIATGGIIYYGPAAAMPTFAGWLGLGATTTATGIEAEIALAEAEMLAASNNVAQLQAAIAEVGGTATQIETAQAAIALESNKAISLWQYIQFLKGL